MAKREKNKLEISKAILIENYIRQIDQKINALKLEYLTLWEKNHNFDSSKIDKEIASLEDERDRVNKLLEQGAREEKISLDLKSFIQAS
ncbi:MAG: hypothetical protein R3277_02700 [Brumimicrobium sp.]|nr:hypothetical protein [Brumimicrobium sp.]